MSTISTTPRGFTLTQAVQLTSPKRLCPPDKHVFSETGQCVKCDAHREPR